MGVIENKIDITELERSGGGGGGTAAAITATQENLAPVEDGVTSAHAYAVGDYIMHQNTLMVVTATIAIGDTLTVGTNISPANNIMYHISDIATGKQVQVTADGVKNTADLMGDLYAAMVAALTNNPKYALITNVMISINGAIVNFANSYRGENFIGGIRIYATVYSSNNFTHYAGALQSTSNLHALTGGVDTNVGTAVPTNGTKFTLRYIEFG